MRNYYVTPPRRARSSMKPECPQTRVPPDQTRTQEGCRTRPSRWFLARADDPDIGSTRWVTHQKRGSDSDKCCRGYGTPSYVCSKGTPAQREYLNWRGPTHTFHTSIAQPYLDDLIASVKGNMHSAGMVQHLCIINVYHFVKRAFSFCMCLSSQELFRRRRKSSGPDPI